MLALTTHDGGAVDDDLVLALAGVWARAVARRDDRPAPDDAAASVPGVRRRLALDGSTLLTARRHGAVLGFALCAPNHRGLELFYLAVDGAGWGEGVAAALLSGVDGHARATGQDWLELWVIDDNTRAIRVYERAGWVPTDDVAPDATSGRRERRMVRRLP